MDNSIQRANSNMADDVERHAGWPGAVGVTIMKLATLVRCLDNERSRHKLPMPAVCSAPDRVVGARAHC
jgi:hypothetical protein